MPGQDAQSFALTTVFNPRNNPQLAAFMSVGSTPGKDYGQIQILQMPRNAQPAGPGQVQNSFETDAKVKNDLFALRQGGTKTVAKQPADDPVRRRPAVRRADVQASGGKEQQPYPILGKILVRYGRASRPPTPSTRR